jgi:hypothetical protein
MILCPVTKLPLSAGVTLSSAEELSSRESENMETPACPWCGQNHPWSSKNALVEQVATRDLQRGVAA